MKKKLITFLLLMVGLSSLLSKNIRSSVDWAVFRNAENKPWMELYYSFSQSEITYVQQKNKFNSLLLAQFKVFKDDSLLRNVAWKNQQSIDDTSLIKESDIVVDQVSFEIPAGEYDCEFSLQDLNEKTNTDTVFFDLTVEENSSKVVFSDLECASTIRRAQGKQDSPFYKNTLLVTPNPSLIYGRKVPMLFFYTELYNLPEKIDSEDTYSLQYYVTDRQDNAVPTIKPKKIERNKAVHPQVEYGMVNVGRLQSGVYNLRIELKHDNTVLADESKEFYVYQSDERRQLTAATRNFNKSPFAQMDSSLAAAEFEYIFYLLNAEAKESWKEVTTLTEKRTFLFNFWNANNTTPEAGINEFRQEYLQRIRYANDNFKAFRRPGWKTDRGRVYVVYGPPDERDLFPNEPNLSPHEKWRYHKLQNGVIFVFAELEGFNHYELIHSNLNGEVHNRNYMDIIRKGSY